MNVVKLGEVTYIVEREEGARKADEVFAELTSDQPSDGRSALDWLPIDTTLVRRAAHIKVPGGLSYADAFAAASAQLLGGVVVACRDDEEFQGAEHLGVRVPWIG